MAGENNVKKKPPQNQYYKISQTVIHIQHFQIPGWLQ